MIKIKNYGNIIFIFLLLNILVSLTNHQVYQYFSFFIGIIILLIKNKVKIPNEKNIRMLYLGLLSYLLMYLISYLSTINLKAIYQTLSLLLLIIYITSIYKSVEKISVNLLIIGELFVLVVSFFCVYKFNSITPNTTGGLICFYYILYSYLIIINDDKKHTVIKLGHIKLKLDYVNYISFFYFLFSLIFILMLSARTAALILIVYQIMYLIRRKYFNIKKRYFIYIFLILFCLTILYAKFSEFSFYDELNSYSRLYFHKNIDSSRGNIWKTLLEQLNGYELIIGKGIGVDTLNYITQGSAHNLYINTLFKTGIIGLLILLLIFKAIWNEIINCKNKEIQWVETIIFIMVIVYNSFEVCLMENKIIIGILQWNCFIQFFIFNRRNKNNGKNINN